MEETQIFTTELKIYTQ